MTIEVMANENQTNLMCNQLAKMVPVHSVKLLVPQPFHPPRAGAV